ncbi:hypothetical protein SAMN05421812_11188 [Asanoa hainanensis]|uniref:Uncharacterized protein n=1 Tax=Asanoa hainanensis TaxID=560556 RepID=A0A239NVQ7_9ACTN|nr:hypothetical protein [Asanoa hainanensis]SNT58915.1 hypothetical protein SAMN05421812_11188 [Asanoa hainanensis]
MTIEDRLAGVLHERADRPVDADALLAATLAAGRARARRRRQGGYAVACAGLAGVVAASLLAIGPGQDPQPGNPRIGWDAMPALPDAAGQAGAADRPDLVGTDPTVLRFAVPWAPWPVQAVGWSAREAVEQVRVQMVTGDVVVSGTVTMWRGADRGENDNASVPNETTSAVVDGHPAVVEQEHFDWGTNQWLTWHPAEGLTVQVTLRADGFQSLTGGTPPERSTVVDVADLVEFANAVRLDATTACSAPFRMTFVPPGGRLVTCSGSIVVVEPGAESRHGALLLVQGDRLVEVDYGTAPPVVEPTGPATPPPVLESTGPAAPPSGSRPPSLLPTLGPDEPGPPDVTATEPSGRILSSAQTKERTLLPRLTAWALYQRGGEADAAAIVEGLDPVGEPTDPMTWPQRPLG